ncbi:hypothetical protein ACWDNI_35710 [Nocardia niigatensis]
MSDLDPTDPAVHIAMQRREIERLTFELELSKSKLAIYKTRLANVTKQRNELRAKLFDRTIAEVQARMGRMSAKARW